MINAINHQLADFEPPDATLPLTQKLSQTVANLSSTLFKAAKAAINTYKPERANISNLHQYDADSLNSEQIEMIEYFQNSFRANTVGYGSDGDTASMPDDDDASSIASDDSFHSASSDEMTFMTANSEASFQTATSSDSFKSAVSSIPSEVSFNSADSTEASVDSTPVQGCLAFLKEKLSALGCSPLKMAGLVIGAGLAIAGATLLGGPPAGIAMAAGILLGYLATQK